MWARWVALWAVAGEVSREPSLRSGARQDATPADADKSLLQMKRLHDEMVERNQTTEQEYTLEEKLLHDTPDVNVPTLAPGEGLDDSSASDAEDQKMAAMVDAEEAARKENGAPKDEDPTEKRFFDDDTSREHWVSAEAEAARRGLYAEEPSSFVEVAHQPWTRPPSADLSSLRERAAEQRRKAEKAETKLADEADEDDPRLGDDDSSLLEEAPDDDGNAEVAQAEADVSRASGRLAKAWKVAAHREEQLRKDPELGPIAKRFDTDQDEYESSHSSLLQAREFPALAPRQDGWRPSGEDLGRVHANMHALHDYFSKVHQRVENDEAAPSKAATPASLAQVGEARFGPYHHRAGGEGKYVDTDTVPHALEGHADPMGEIDAMRHEWKRDEARFRAEADEEDSSDEPPALVQAEESLSHAAEQEKEADARALEKNRIESVQEQPMAAEAEEHLAAMVGKPPLPTDPTDEIAELTHKPPLGWIGPSSGWVGASSLLDRGPNPLADERAAVQKGLAKLAERMRHAEDTIAAPGTESKLARLTAAKVGQGESSEEDPLAAMLAEGGGGHSAKRAAAMSSDAQKLLESWAKKPHAGTSLAELSDPAYHRLALERQAEMEDQLDRDQLDLKEHESKKLALGNRDRVLAFAKDDDGLGPDPPTRALGRITPLEYALHHRLPQELQELQDTLDNPPYKTDPNWFHGEPEPTFKPSGSATEARMRDALARENAGRPPTAGTARGGLSANSLGD